MLQAKKHGTQRFYLLAFFYLLSGCACTIYQVSWQRILALHTGVTVFAMTSTIGVFLAGLGIGSLFGGKVSEKLGAQRCLFYFSVCELLIAFLGFASSSILIIHFDLGIYSNAATITIHMAYMFVATFLMGISLPLLTQASTDYDDSLGGRVGILYGLNTLGAAIGAAVTPWVLFRNLGVSTTIYFAAILSSIAGAFSYLLFYNQNKTLLVTKEKISSDQLRYEVSSLPIPYFGLVFLYALSGFCAIALEILWFRVMDVAVKSTAFTFGTLLSVFLFWMGLGSVAGTFLVKRSKVPSRDYLLIQTLIYLFAAVSVIAIVRLSPVGHTLNWFYRFWGQYDGLGSLTTNLLTPIYRLYVLLPTFMFGIPTFLMGLSFNYLNKAIQKDRRSVGLNIGVLQCANIFGSVCASFVVGIFMLNFLGTAWSFKIIFILAVVFAIIGSMRFEKRIFIPAIVVLGVAIIYAPDQRQLWARFHGKSLDATMFFSESSSGVTFIAEDSHYGWRLSTNGLGMSWIPFGGIHTWLGAVPAAIHPNPSRVAVVGLGSGDTAWAIGCRRDIPSQKILIYELNMAQIDALRNLSGAKDFLELKSFLADNRYSFIEEDGRKAILSARDESEYYDLIELDAIRPESAYSGNLYSLEFFNLLKSRLRKNGIVATWNPTARVQDTFTQTFPHVISMGGGQILVGSSDPIEINFDKWIENLNASQSKEYLGPNRHDDVLRVLFSAVSVSRKNISDLNTDLWPKDEFILPTKE